MFRQGGVTLSSIGVSMPAYCAFTNTLSVGNTVETWKFYRDLATTQQVAQWVLTYADSTRAVLVSGLFTDLSAT